MKKLIYIAVIAAQLVVISGCSWGFVPTWPHAEVQPLPLSEINDEVGL
ncbi:MAG: hypothetical protein WEC84_01565 [Candidatus Andersenbacteria bacterium]